MRQMTGLCWVLSSSDSSNAGIRGSIPDSICLGAAVLNTGIDGYFLDGSFPNILNQETGGPSNLVDQRIRRFVPGAAIATLGVWLAPGSNRALHCAGGGS